MLKRSNRNSIFLSEGKEREKERGSLSPSNSASSETHFGLGTSKLAFLSRAIEKNREEEALAILKSTKGGPVTSETDLNGRNCAHICAAVGTYSMFLQLLNFDLEYNASDDNGHTPLHLAASSLRLEIVEKLLSLPIDVKAVDKNGQTAFHSLVAQSKIPREKKTFYIKLCKEMIGKGMDLTARNGNGDTVLHEAVKHGNATATKLLVEQRGIEIDPTNINKETPLHYAAKRGDKRLIKILVEKEADITMEGPKGTPIMIAKEAGQQEAVSLLMQYIEKKRKQSSKMATNRKTKLGEEDVIKQLEFYAEKKDRCEEFKNLVAEYKIDNQKLINTTSNTGRNLMMIANYHGNWELVSYLLSKGFPVNGQDKNGWTNLHYAACSDNSKVILSLLKQRDINVNIKNADQTTALHYIAKNVFFPKELPEIFDALQQKFMYFNSVNVNGETALHNSCWKGNVPATKLLIERGVGVNIKNRKNETALHWAVRAGHEEIVQLLIQNGADLAIKGDDGTPLEIAQKALDPKNSIITSLGGKPKTKEQNENDKRSWFHHMLNKQKEQQNGSDVASDVKFELPVNLNWLIKESEVEVHELLGSGRFGSVYRGTYRGQTVAVKHLQNVNGKYELQKEFDIMSSMRSPRVVYFYGVVLTPPFTAYMVMSYCAKGSLTSVLRDVLFQLDWPLVFKWCRQIVQGTSDLHSWVPQIIHRDLKSLNLLVDEYCDCVVSDFGISRFVVDDNLSTLSKLRGTYAYCAPEIYLGQPAGVKSDVFSLGIIFWEIVSRCIRGEYIRPYSEYKHLIIDFQIIIQVAKDKLRPKLPNGCPQLMADLIQNCWDSAEEQRPTCKEILERLKECSRNYELHPELWPRFQPKFDGGNALDNLFSPGEDDKEEEMEDEDEQILLSPQITSQLAKEAASTSTSSESNQKSSQFVQPLINSSYASSKESVEEDKMKNEKTPTTVGEGHVLTRSFPSFRVPTRIASAPDSASLVPSPETKKQNGSFLEQELKKNSSQESQESNSPRSPPKSLSPRVSKSRSNRSSASLTAEGSEDDDVNHINIESAATLRSTKSPKSPAKSKFRLSLRGSKSLTKQEEMTWFDYIQTTEYAESVKDSPLLKKK